MKIQTTKSFFIYFIFILSIFFTEIVAFIFYITNNHLAISTTPFCIILFPIFYFSLKRQFSFEKIKINKWIIIGIGLISILTLSRIGLPDKAYDTINYHIFLQNSQFADNINWNFFPGGLGTFIPALPDKVFYFFRLLLGFRLGTILNTFVLVIIFQQLLIIFNKLLYKEKQETNNNKYLVIAALFTVSTEYILFNIGTYLVDIIVIPILLELLSTYLFNEKYSQKLSYFFALLIGLSFTIKSASISFVIPLLLLYLFKFRKSIDVKTIITSILLIITPSIPYMVFSYISTGNPTFFMLNKFFKSPYFPIENFKDTRWGPTNILETISWPFIALFHPEKLSELQVYSGRLPLGLITTLIGIPFLLTKKWYQNKGLLELIIFFLTSLLIWIITTGYIRYALPLEIIAGVITILIIHELLINNRKTLKKIGIAFLSLAIIQSIYGNTIFITGRNWNLEKSFFIEPSKHIENFSLLGQDHENQMIEFTSELSNISNWIIIGKNVTQGFIPYTEGKTKIIYLNWKQFSPTPLVIESLKDIKDEEFYSLIRPEDLQESLNILQSYNLFPTRFKEVSHPYINIDQKLILIQLSKYKYGEEITLTINGGWSFKEKGSIEKTWNNGKHSSINLAITPTKNELILKIKFIPFLVPEKLSKQTIYISINKEKLPTKWEITSKTEQELEVKIPKKYTSNNSLEIGFEFPNATSPSTLIESPDKRKLAIAVISAIITENN